MSFFNFGTRQSHDKSIMYDIIFFYGICIYLLLFVAILQIYFLSRNNSMNYICKIVPVKNFYYKTNIFQNLVVLNKFMQLPMIIFARVVFLIPSVLR